MFSKSKTASKAVATSSQPKSGSASKPDSAQKKAPPSIISANMHVLGDLETDGDVQIDGQIDGNLRTRIITIGETATVNGEITGETIRIAGSVNGEIRGGAVILASTARVVGDILHDSLSIDAGAFVQGLCKRAEEEESFEPPAAIPAKP